MKIVTAIALLVTGSLVNAQPASRIDTSNGAKAFEACVISEINPMEEKATQAFDRLLAKYKDNLNLRIGLQSSKRAFRAYQNAHCMFTSEAYATTLGYPSGQPIAKGTPEPSAQPSEGKSPCSCFTQTLEHWLRELEAL